jgi:hypothetical protein
MVGMDAVDASRSSETYLVCPAEGPGSGKPMAMAIAIGNVELKAATWGV